MGIEETGQVNRITYYPESWGILIRYVSPRWKAQIAHGVPEKDIVLLHKMREKFRDEFYGEPVPYKGYIEEEFVANKNKGMNATLAALHRLHAAGLVEKFAGQLHTQSGRLEYIGWFLWEDCEVAPIRGDTGTPVYIGERWWGGQPDSICDSHTSEP